MKKTLFFFIVVSLIVSCKKTIDEPSAPLPPIPPAPKVPIVETYPVTDVTLFSITLNGKLIDTVGSKVTETGLVADTLPSPTTTKNVNKFIKTADGSGNFSVIVTNIPSNKKWYVRAYAISAQGIGYGKEETFNSLPEKVYVGDAILTNQQEVNSFGANNYTTIKGSLLISGPVTDLSSLHSLVIIGSGVEIINTQISNFNGLDNIEIIGNNFTSSFRIERNHLLTNFNGLSSLKIVDGDFLIYNNDGLVNLMGLDNFTTQKNFEFSIYGCDNLTSIAGLEKMLIIAGDIWVKDNPLLTDLSAWNNLVYMPDRIRIINNASLQKIQCFEKLKNIEGIELIDNPLLDDISGFRNLQTVTGIILVDNNDALSNLSAFNNITTIEYIKLKNNGTITNLEGFKNLQTIKYQLLIENNSSLTNMQGLGRLKSISKLEILSNSSLLNLNGLDSLSAIIDNPYSIIIWQNGQLQSLDGLQKLRTAHGSIQITRNSALTNFCGLKPLFMAGYSDFFYTEFNAINPTQSQVVSSCP